LFFGETTAFLIGLGPMGWISGKLASPHSLHLARRFFALCSFALHASLRLPIDVFFVEYMFVPLSLFLA
jgi:hypothetical protein